MSKKIPNDDSDSEEIHSNINDSKSKNIKEDEYKTSKSEIIDVTILNKKRKRIKTEPPSDYNSSKENQKETQITTVDHEKKELKDENENKNKNESVFFNEDKIIFRYESIKVRIDSVFVFSNGDILIFMYKNTTLFDGKTFSPKLKLDFIDSVYCFCYISEEEFITFKNNQFSIYIFENQRTSIKLCNEINCEFIIKIHKLSNDDLAIICIYNNNYILKIFRKINLDEYNNDSQKTSNYQYILYKTTNDPINELLEINTNTILTIRKEIDKLIFSIYDIKNNYTKIKANKIKTSFNGKTKIYIVSPFYKTKNNKKIIAAGFGNIISIRFI